ncbi:hypothetical protein B0H12DRAFT_1092223 [Mycena haematopus]|nr:hypothetical protein B0H12DRAFT_1121343 [Mycena haematopus]KAJ7271973.1 hypothetical protein B0H12DRAFT_1092223 [Mycena haematopus]
MAKLLNTEFLEAIRYPRSTTAIALVAKFAYELEVLELFYEPSVFRADDQEAFIPCRCTNQSSFCFFMFV